MRIEIEDIFSEDVPVIDVQHLGDSLLRLRPARPLKVSPYHRYLLEGGTDPSRLSPEAPNRAAVESNLELARRGLAEAFAGQRGATVLQRAGVETERDLLRLNVAHFSEPHWLYTNAQDVVSVVERAGPVFEVIAHAYPFSSLHGYLQFGSEYGPWRLVDARQGARFASLSAAETWIGVTLARVRVSPLSMAMGGERRTVFLQGAGARRGDRGYPIQTFLLHHPGGVRRERVKPGESYRFLNELDLDGFRARTCATCRHFAFSGMSWDMSNGEAGYCEKRERDREARQPHDSMTGVFDACEQQEMIDDAARSRRYL
jgi:hypothetical protein